MKRFKFGSNGDGEIEQVATKMLETLFGHNVVLMTQFEFLSIEDKVSVMPKYYYTERFKFFDFWYNPKHEWLPQLALAMADYYHGIRGIKGNRTKTANWLLKEINDEEPLS